MLEQGKRLDRNADCCQDRTALYISCGSHDLWQPECCAHSAQPAPKQSTEAARCKPESDVVTATSGPASDKSHARPIEQCPFLVQPTIRQHVKEARLASQFTDIVDLLYVRAPICYHGHCVTSELRLRHARALSQHIIIHSKPITCSLYL